MSAFAAGLADQGRRLLRTPRLLAMAALCLGASWLMVGTYARPVVRDLPVAVLDQDGTGLTRTVRRFLDATPELRLVDPPESYAAAERALVRGDLAAVVLLPEGFTADVKRGRRAGTVVAVDMSNILVGRTASRAVQKVLATVAAGAQISLLQKLGEPADRAPARVLPVQAQESLELNPGSSYAAYLAPGFALFFVHVLAVLLAFGALPPQAPPCPPAEAAGRLAAVWLLCLALGLAAAWLLLPGAGLAPRSHPLLLALLLGALLAADLVLAAAMASLGRGGLFPFQLSVMLTMLSFMFSGLTWPRDALPAPLQALAAAIPFTPFGLAARRLVLEPVGLPDLARPLGWLALQALAGLLVLGAGRLLRGRREAAGSPA